MRRFMCPARSSGAGVAPRRWRAGEAQARESAPIASRVSPRRSSRLLLLLLPPPSSSLRDSSDENSTLLDESRDLLRRFWKARGILDPDAQSLLVDAWQSARDSSSSSSSESESEQEEDEASRYSSPSPRLPPSVAGRVASPEAAAAEGDAALSLHALLGSRPELDVPSMCAREPKLLSAGNAALMQRLLWLRGEGPKGLDVGALVSSQPSLLLQPLLTDSSSDAAASLSEDELRLLEESPKGEKDGEESESEEEQETPEELLRSWKAGLTSDSKSSWVSRFLSLKRYITENGDAAVGTRGGDDPGLVRWAEKQRADFAGTVVGERGGRGTSSFRRRSFSSPSSSGAPPRPSFLKPYRKLLLESVGFCFDAEEAEFARMVSAAAAAGAGGKGSAGSGAATATTGIGGGGASSAGSGFENGKNSRRGDELLLANWCSVQRIARRSGVLSAGRIAQLEAIGFDFDGADALS